MTDINNQNISSPSSISSSSSNDSFKIKIKRSISKTSTTKRRSQRPRKNVQSLMQSSSLPTTILHEKTPIKKSISNTNNNQQIEKHSSSISTDKLVFNPTATTNSKSSYWTVTDRESEWYKLSIPIHSSILNPTNEKVPFKRLLKLSERKKSHSNNNNDRITQPIDTTQLIMKAVMHELDYDIDDDDLEFLYKLNQHNKSKQKRQLNEEEFENAIIILEFSTAEKIRSYLKQKSCEDDNIVCDICLLPDADDGNEMIFCERCNCCVHQNCYGIPIIPSGTWLCKPCSILRRPSCILCPKLGGPLKCTASGTVWCHLTCALWIPELKFVDYNKMEPVLYLNKIPHARWSLRCVVCSTTEGACVQCAHKNCRTPFHVTCGLSAGYFLDIEQTSSKESRTSSSQFNAYCLKHSDEARKHSEEEIISNEDDSSSTSSLFPTIPLTVYRRNQLKSEQWINQCYEKFPTYLSSLHLYEECPEEYDEYTSKRIYEYWIDKRQFNKKLPLIKRIDFVFDQRENSELLITQINNCLKIQHKISQLQIRCQSMFDSSSSSSTLTQRLETLKKSFTHDHHRRHDVNKHEMKNKMKLLKKKTHQKYFYSSKQYQAMERAKRCIVKLESTYRQNLQFNTTYLIGKTLQGQTILLPKQLIEQANVITIPNHQEEQRKNFSSIDYSDISDDDDIEPVRKKGLFKPTKTTYTSQGNVVTCITGSFN